VCGGAGPDGVLLGAGQHRDGLDELGVGWQGTVRVRVGAQDVRQHDGVAVVGLAPGDRVPVAVACHGHRVDREHRPSGGPQAGGQQPPRGLDRDRDRILGAVAVLGQQGQQAGQSGRVIVDTSPRQQVAALVYQGDVVVVLGPVDAAVHVTHGWSPVSCCWCACR
jgi:hypothetical protein